jgi:hypothetical protein
MDLSMFYFDDDESFSEEIVELCEELRRNDPHMETVFLGRGIDLSVCDALLNCTVVSKISVSMPHFTLILDRSNGDKTCESILKKFFEYVGSSPTLRTVSLTDGRASRDEYDDNFCIAMLSALAQNPHITTLQSSQVFPPDSFAGFLTSTTTITSLEITVPDFYFEDLEEKEVIARGLRGNQSLESLKLPGLEATSHATQIFRCLGGHPKLRELSLERNQLLERPDELSTLSAMLRSSNLQSLSLSRYYLDSASWKCLRKALKARPTITKFSLERCGFEVQTARDVVHFLKQSSVVDFRICALSSSLYKRILPCMMLELLVESSTLHQLHVEGTSNVDWHGERQPFSLLNEMGADVQIPCLHLEMLEADESRELANWLPRSLVLRELSVDCLGAGFQTSRFVRAVRENGSLFHLVIPERYSFGFDPIVSNPDRRIIHACCERNQQLPKLLADCRRCIVNSSDSILHLFPTLFAAAQQSPRMARSTMLIGLLTADEVSA